MTHRERPAKATSPLGMQEITDAGASGELIFESRVSGFEHVLRQVGTLRSGTYQLALWSKHVDCRKMRNAHDTVPKVNCETDVTGPQRIPSAADDDLRAAILDNRSHCELSGAVKPEGILRAAIELEERVAVPTRAVAKIRPLGQRPGGPGEAAAIQEKCVELRRREGVHLQMS